MCSHVIIITLPASHCQTRRAIQDHALRLFGEQGYDETTVEQIAAAAEISPLTLSVPAIRARSFDSMHHSSVGMFAELIAERTGRARDDPKVRLFTWAVMGAIQSSIFSWADSDGALDLPKLVDEALEFLADGCPL